MWGSEPRPVLPAAAHPFLNSRVCRRADTKTQIALRGGPLLRKAQVSQMFVFSETGAPSSTAPNPRPGPTLKHPQVGDAPAAHRAEPAPQRPRARLGGTSRVQGPALAGNLGSRYPSPETACPFH